MKLVVDLGNTTSKFFFFSEKELTDSHFHQGVPDRAWIERILFHDEPFTSAILSSVIDTPIYIKDIIDHHCPLLIFDESTPIPIKNLYKTPETLGYDRLAAAIGGSAIFPDDPVPVIEAGTCIKYELVANNAYQGGIIAPGLFMQASALHTFTSKLPLVDLKTPSDVPLTGIDTTSSLRSGIINATLASIHGIIERYMVDFPDLKIILSGGDMKYFVKWLKYSIFALPNLVAAGLNEILDFNEKNLY